MAHTPVLWQQASAYPAQADRQLLAALWPSGGALGAAVTAVPNGMQVSVAAGSAAVPLQSGQGSALCHWDAAELVTLDAAPGSGTSRIDLIVCQVRDHDLDGGDNNDFVLTPPVKGTAQATPVAPAVPANAFALAQVTVPGAAANLNAATITPMAGPLSVARGQLAYAQITATVGGITGPIDVPGLALGVFVPAGRRLKVTGYCPSFGGGNASDMYSMQLADGTTGESWALANCFSGPSGYGVECVVVGVISPPAGRFAVKLQANHILGGAAGNFAAYPYWPAWLLVEDIGAA